MQANQANVHAVSLNPECFHINFRQSGQQNIRINQVQNTCGGSLKCDSGALILLSRSHSLSSLWIWLCCSLSRCEWHKRCFEIRYEQTELPDWDASVDIWFEYHFKPPPNVVWIQIQKSHFMGFSCRPDFLKINLDTIWICQKPDVPFELVVWTLLLTLSRGLLFFNQRCKCDPLKSLYFYFIVGEWLAAVELNIFCPTFLYVTVLEHESTILKNKRTTELKNTNLPMNIFINKAKGDDSLSPARLVSPRSLTLTYKPCYIKSKRVQQPVWQVSKLEGECICQLLLFVCQGIHTLQRLIDGRPMPSLMQSMTIFHHELIDSALYCSQCLTHSSVINVITACQKRN